MSVSYFVVYRGSVPDPDGFAERYREKHVPLLKRWPGIEGVTLHTPFKWSDPQSVKPSNIFLLAQMHFASAEVLAGALNSDARIAARSDLPNFPAYEGEMLHQAMYSQKL